MPVENRIQLHLSLQFKKDPRDHPRVAALLADGYEIEELQRLTDMEAAVTLRRKPAAPAESAS